MLKIILPVVVGITLIDSVAQLQQLAWTLLLCQGYVALELNREYLGGFNRLLEMGHGGMDNNSVAIALVTAAGLGFFLAMEATTWRRKAAAFVALACLGHAVLFSFSRGGMLGLIVAGGVSFFLIPRRPKHYAFFGLAVVAGLILAGPQVRARFMTTFADGKKRDGSAESRLELWGNCLDTMGREPMFGEGPDHFPLVVHRYGWQRGKEAHTLWLQLGAELGVPALAFLLLFYGLTIRRLWKLARGKIAVPDPWLKPAACMSIAALIGFAVSAQFVSLKTLELPYYVALLGMGTLKLATLLPNQTAHGEEPREWTVPGLLPDPFLRQPVTVGVRS
jgi:O-antigen ligase